MYVYRMHVFIHILYILSLYSDENKGPKPQTNDKTTERANDPNTIAGEHGLVNDSERHEEELTNTKNGAHIFSVFRMMFDSGLGYNRRV